MELTRVESNIVYDFISDELDTQLHEVVLDLEDRHNIPSKVMSAILDQWSQGVSIRVPLECNVGEMSPELQKELKDLILKSGREDLLAHNVKLTKVEPNYKREDLIRILEENYDLWSEDGDWWHGRETWDVNVYECYNSKLCRIEYSITVYGVEQVDDDETYQVDTSTELDHFVVTV